MDWSFVIKHAVNLLILIGIIIYFSKTPIKKALEKRRSNLSREIDRAKIEIDDAKTKFEEYSKKIDSLEAETTSLIQSIREIGENEKKEIIVQAEKTCELIKKETTETIELETFRARQKIQQEVIANSVELAEKLIREKMGDEYNVRSVDKLISQIEEGKWLQ